MAEPTLITNRSDLIKGLSQFARSSTREGLKVFLIDYLSFLVALAGVVWLPSLWMKVLAGVFAGIKTGNLITLGHEAAHGSLVVGRRLNYVIAVLCFQSGFFNYRLWCWDHHLLHHPRPNGDHPDVYQPLSKAEYDALPAWRRALQRLYRHPSLLGLGLYYFLERWLQVKIWPRSMVPQELRKSAWQHTAGLAAWAAVLWTFLLCAPLYSHTSSLEAFLLGFVLPQYVFMTVVAGTLFLQHNHPRLPWFRDNQPEHYAVPEYLATHYSVPHWLSHLTHAVFTHSVHHLHPRIPCYHAEEAQAWMNARSQGALVSEPLGFGTIVRVMRQCKLYDYENHRWLDWNGNPVGSAIPLHAKAPKSSAAGAETMATA